MDSKIWACYIVYNNVDYLRASLETVLPYVDRAIVVDGRYRTYPGDEWHSTDGTLDIIKDMGDKVTLVPAQEWESQVEKRNVYMDMVPNGDWIFVIDGDELMFGNNKQLKNEIAQLDSKIIRFRQENVDGSVRIRAKLFKKEEGLRYRGYHFNINTPTDHRSWKSILAYEAPIVNCTKFIHLSTDIREETVKENKQTFYDMRRASETPEWMFDQQIEYFRMVVANYDQERLEQVESPTENSEEAKELWLKEMKWSMM